jgi:hypothetical protein
MASPHQGRARLSLKQDAQGTVWSISFVQECGEYRLPIRLACIFGSSFPRLELGLREFE